jgi:hypothetical protein
MVRRGTIAIEAAVLEIYENMFHHFLIMAIKMAILKEHRERRRALCKNNTQSPKQKANCRPLSTKLRKDPLWNSPGEVNRLLFCCPLMNSNGWAATQVDSE